MNLTNIQTFLCVAYHQSLSVAASMLYLSQPTVSARLQQLEEELGTTLVVRKKGVRTIELTPQGLAFVPLAERWMTLEAETESFAKQQYLAPLTIACPDSLNNYLFPALYKKLSCPEYNLALRIRTQQSQEIFKLVENREADVGFAFYLSRSSNVRCKPVLSEPMVLLCSKNGNWPEGPISPRSLNPRHELYLPWSQDIQIWHDSWWSPAVHPYVYVDNVALLTIYLDDPKTWAFCPASVAKAFLQEERPVDIRPLTEGPPNRVCYMLTERTPRSAAASAAVAVFEGVLHDFLKEQAAGFRISENPDEAEACTCETGEKPLYY